MSVASTEQRLPDGFSAPPVPLRKTRRKPDWLVAYMFLAPAAAIFAAFIAYPLADGITTLVALFVLASVIRKAEFGQPPSIAMSNQPLSQ